MNWLEMVVFKSTKWTDDLEMILKWMHNLIYNFAYRKCTHRGWIIFLSLGA